MDEQWNYHAASGSFAQYNNFDAGMAATYGPASSLENYMLKAQVMAYDGERAMFEAYGANKYRSTGVIQWMLNNAWPSFSGTCMTTTWFPAGDTLAPGRPMSRCTSSIALMTQGGGGQLHAYGVPGSAGVGQGL